jgi:hypothetical protein
VGGSGELVEFFESGVRWHLATLAAPLVMNYTDAWIRAKALRAALPAAEGGKVPAEARRALESLNSVTFEPGALSLGNHAHVEAARECLRRLLGEGEQ